MDWIQIVLEMFGGLSIFLYGMYIASKGLEKAASHNLRLFLERVTSNQIYGSIAGIVLAAVLQSSTAAIVMVVGFVNAGLIGLRRALGVVLGSAIGTTFTVQLMAFKITDYALAVVSLGVLFILVSSTSKIKYVGSILLGFGFVFFSLGLMTQSMAPVQDSPAFIQFLLGVADRPLLTFLISTVFTIIIQNSAATIAMAMSLTSTGALELAPAVVIVYGANVGTVVTAIISSLSASKDAKRTAWAHALFKIIGVLLIFPFHAWFVRFIEMFGGDIDRQIANAHTIFNVVNLVVLLPFCNAFSRWMVVLIPDREKHKVRRTCYLDKESIAVPAVALLKVRKELSLMAKKINDQMFAEVPSLLEKGSHEHRKHFEHVESEVDAIYRDVFHYINRINAQDLSIKEAEEGIKLLYINNDLEAIADCLESLANITTKFEDRKKVLSQAQQERLFTLYEEVARSFEQAVKSFVSNDDGSAIKVVRRNPLILRLEKELRYEHFYSGASDSSRTSAAFVDMMNELLRINHHTVNISHTVIGVV